MIKIVIFDFDDTLVDNRQLDYEGFVIPCTQLGLKIPKPQEISKFRMKGLLAEDIARFLISKNNKKTLNKFLSIRRNFLENQESIKFIHLKKDVKTILSLLKSKKIKCYLCSVRNNKKVLINFFKKTKILQYFSRIYISEDLDFKIDNLHESNRILIKSSLLHKIVKESNFPKNEIFFIGDSIDDLKAAKNNHISFINIINPYQKKKILNMHLNTIKNMNELGKKLSI